MSGTHLHFSVGPSHPHCGPPIEPFWQDALVHGEELEDLGTVEEVLAEVVHLGDLVLGQDEVAFDGHPVRWEWGRVGVGMGVGVGGSGREWGWEWERVGGSGREWEEVGDSGRNGWGRVR